MRNDFAIIVSTLMLLLALAVWVWIGVSAALVTMLILTPTILILLVFSGKSRNSHGRRAITIDPNTDAPLVLGGEYEKSIHGTVGEKGAIAQSLKKQRKGKGKKVTRK